MIFKIGTMFFPLFFVCCFKFIYFSEPQLIKLFSGLFVEKSHLQMIPVFVLVS